MYERALAKFAKVRQGQKDIKTFVLCYLMENLIVDSLCSSFCNGIISKNVEREEMKEYRTAFKKIENEIQYSTEYCGKFLEQINALYEKDSQKSISRESTIENNLISKEFAAYFFKSLSTALLGSINSKKIFGLEDIEDKVPLIETCMELRRMFMINSILMIAVNYLLNRMKAIIDSDGHNVAELNNEDFLVVIYEVNEHRECVMKRKTY